jgi:hypothetical protein
LLIKYINKLCLLIFKFALHRRLFFYFLLEQFLCSLLFNTFELFFEFFLFTVGRDDIREVSCLWCCCSWDRLNFISWSSWRPSNFLKIATTFEGHCSSSNHRFIALPWRNLESIVFSEIVIYCLATSWNGSSVDSAVSLDI